MRLDYHPPPPPPPTLYRPPSPTSSTDSSDNSNHSSFLKLQQEQSIRIDTASQIPGAYNPFDSPNPNPSRPSSSSPPERGSARYGMHHRRPDADAVFPPEYQPSASSGSASYHSRRSPPPEPIFPTSQPGHQPAAWQDFAYVPSSRGVISPPSSASGPALVPTPPPQTASESRADAPSIAASWRQPSPSTAAAPDEANVDQLIYELISPTRPGMGSSPNSPSPLPPTAIPDASSSHASGSRGAVMLASAPAPPVYHPHLQYPISPPGGKADLEGKTYSFVSLPGNTIKKRPRRRYEEIERLYKCNFEGCSKSYGTLNHLNAHVHMQRHGAKRTPGEFKEMRKVWRKQRKEAEEDESMVAGPSSAGTVGPSASYDRGPRPKRRRRATEPSLPSIATLEDSTEEEYPRRDSGLRGQPYGHALPGGRRVSMDEYMEVAHQRRSSLDSHEGTIPEEVEEEEREEDTSPLGAQRSTSTTMSVATRAAELQLSPVPAEAPLSSMRYWQQQSAPPQEQVHLHPVGAQPIHPPSLVQQETLPSVAPHASHLPGPGPAAPTTYSNLSQDTSHTRSAVSYSSPTQPSGTQPRQPVYPPAVPRSGARHPSLSYSESQQQQDSNVAPMSPPPLQQARLGSPSGAYQPPRSIQQVASTVILAPTPQPQNLPSLATSQQHQQTGRLGLSYPMSPPSHVQSGPTTGYPATPPATIHPAYPTSPAPSQHTQQQQQHGSHAHPAYPPTHSQISHASYSHSLSRPLPSLPSAGYLTSPPQYPASPPRTEPLQSEQRLHSGSMLLTPLSVGHPHRLPYLPSVVSPTSYVTSGSSLAGAVGTPEARGPGLPTRYGVATTTQSSGAASGRATVQQQHYSAQREQRFEPSVQQSQPQWDTTYSTTSLTNQPQQSQQQHLYQHSDNTYDAALSRPVATSRTTYMPTPAQTQLDAYVQQRASATYLASPVMIQRPSLPASDTYARYIPPPAHSQRQDTYATTTPSGATSQQATDTLGYSRGQQQTGDQPQTGTYESHQGQRIDPFSQSQQVPYYPQHSVSEPYYAQQQQQQHGHGAYPLHQQQHPQSQQTVASPHEPSAEQYSTISPQNVQQSGIPPQAQHQPQDPRLYPQYGARGHPGPSDSGY
ncbi:hypothetical protein FRB93_011787 [Tulasnella sp. JGI-2019a]|nr:hypothetical protein FRB93_011787 [Tulasnella sp. JGI-2019a]